jgi:hypothetical protein
MIERRKFLTGLISLVAAPAIVRAGSLMPVKAMEGPVVLREIDLMVYGRSPAMDALPSFAAMNEMNELRERINRAFFLEQYAIIDRAIADDHSAA